MESKRSFKKFVNELAQAICSDMMAVSIEVPGVNTDAIDQAIIKVLKGAEVALMMANAKFDKTESAFANRREYNKARRAFYKTVFDKAHTEFAECNTKALAEFNAAVPAEVKAANKAK